MMYTITSKPGMTPYSHASTLVEARRHARMAQKVGLDGRIYADIWASIQEDPAAPRISISLRQDRDAWRWYEIGSDADTEVSGSTVAGAVRAAKRAWRLWDIRMENW